MNASTMSAAEAGGRPSRGTVWLTVAQAGEHTHLSRFALYRLVKKGLLRRYRPGNGRNILFDRDELDEAIRRSATGG